MMLRVTRSRAYPRIRGGNFHTAFTIWRIAGLSPHTRGKRPLAPLVRPSAGPIPAYAGETMSGALQAPLFGAYPRIRGGNYAAQLRTAWREGLSPHTRGKRYQADGSRNTCGPIPAYAGETLLGIASLSATRAYPRIRGGNHEFGLHASFRQGLSPHTRGKRVGAGLGAGVSGPIPAYAGETAKDNCLRQCHGAYPRIRGGNCKTAGNKTFNQGLSPHTRGKPGRRE